MTVKRQIKINSFSKFSLVINEQNLVDVIENIQSGKYKNAIDYYRQLLGENPKKAEKYKKQLPCFCLSATYTKRRRISDIKNYNDLIIIDIDNVKSTEELNEMKLRVAKDESTLCAFISPSGKGLKIFAFLLTKKAQKLREEIRSKEYVTQDELIAYHKHQFVYAVKHYERILKTTVDVSGSDIGRLCFISSDSKAFINTSLINILPHPITEISHTAPLEEKSYPVKQKISARLLKKEEQNCLISLKDISDSHQKAYKRFIKQVEKNHSFKKGERNNYLYQLGQICFNHNFPVQEALSLTINHFPTIDFDITEPIVNAYTYSKKSLDLKSKGDTINAYLEIVNVILDHYDLRYNTLIEDLEIRRKNIAEDTADSPDEEEKEMPSLLKEDINETFDKEYTPISTQDINTIAIKLETEGFKISKKKLDIVLTSNYFPKYNPITNYLSNLPKWDGNDYIDQFAQRVPVKKELEADFKDAIKRWLVAMMASLIDENVTNQEVFVLYSQKEGCGKSTWCRRLIPPEWKTLYHEGFIDPKRVDHQLLLAHCVLINLDDLSGFQRENMNEMKRYITQNRITERKAYARNIKTRDRKASIVGSTNRKHFLKDYYGERRFRVFTVEGEIDNHDEINYPQLYAQALHLYQNKFRYWYNAEENERINEQNREYELRSREDELIFQFIEKPCEENRDCATLISASEIAVIINDKTHHSMSDEATSHITAVLDMEHFETRRDSHGVVLYLVILKYDPNRRF